MGWRLQKGEGAVSAEVKQFSQYYKVKKPVGHIDQYFPISVEICFQDVSSSVYLVY